MMKKCAGQVCSEDFNHLKFMVKNKNYFKDWKLNFKTLMRTTPAAYI